MQEDPACFIHRKEKNMNENTPNPWDDAPTTAAPVAKTKKSQTVYVKPAEPAAPVAPRAESNADFDIDGLMTDFPTATELERFVYDQTGVVLNLKGRANKLKYQVAMDVLNGVEVDPKYIGGDNPYIDKTELIPEDPLKPVPARDASLPDHEEVQNTFYSPFIPHPDADYRNQGKKVGCIFRKYKNGMISYEILGPLEKQPHGSKIDKYGRTRPEVIRWVDPRSGEQVIVREDGTLTPQGRRIRAMMQTFKVNKTNQWEVWVDREFISLNDSVAANPWDLTK
jgi:hypothetical protein